MCTRTRPVALTMLATVALAVSASASQLVVTSDPPGAEVRVNGEPRGVTPLNTEIAATAVGQCEIAVSLEGHQPVRMAYTIVPGQFETLHFYLFPAGASPPLPDTPVQPDQDLPVGVTDLETPADAVPTPPAGDRELREWLAGLLPALGMLR